ncbi:MAG TPA: hypothetical protein VFP32_02630, partial [Candidatus Saccharimonadales bacterium]|nr:hypothetical protein [Candidatus Saccharimonadales bacterium]
MQKQTERYAATTDPRKLADFYGLVSQESADKKVSAPRLKHEKSLPRKAGELLGGAAVIASVVTVAVEAGSNLLRQAGTPNPATATAADIMRAPYKVGFKPEDQLVSEIASDMHAFAPGDDQTEADDAIDTYLPKADQQQYRVRAGEEFTFLVDKRTGKIMPQTLADNR